ncbi:MAG: acyl-CoA dehydrogenase [Chloroflexi bacterium]|nr:acyl-CoA dehydrogenase [Chloroflexota bacterium]
MDFSFTEEQEMLRTMARDFLANECPKSKVRELDKDEKGYDPQMWRNMAELGWMGLVFPEEYGGTGASFVDLVALMEEMGRNIVPGPFFSTIALCALAILEFGTNEQKAKFLPQIAKGETIWTLASMEQTGSYETSEINLSARPDGDDYVLEGEKIFVSDAHVANYILVVARTGKGKAPQARITVFIVDAKSPALRIEIIPTMAGDRQFQVIFNKAKVSKNDILGAAGGGWEVVNFILQRAAVLKCAEISGACQAVLDMTSAYAKERVQFDRPIGSFQAVQQKLADMLIDIEAIQYLVYQAACGISEGEPSQLQISVAKAKASQAYEKICIDGITAHGAIGFTFDHDIGLYFRRVKAAEFAAGDVDLHRGKIAAELGL